jgi:hypothetical protein
MEGCHNCRVVVDSSQKTVRLYKGDEEVDLPEGFTARLHGTLRVAWERKHAKSV